MQQTKLVWSPTQARLHHKDKISDVGPVTYAAAARFCEEKAIPLIIRHPSNPLPRRKKA